MLPTSPEVLWHPPLLAHKASPGNLALLLTAPVTRLSYQLTNWNVLFSGNFLKESNFQPPVPLSEAITQMCLDICNAIS